MNEKKEKKKEILDLANKLIEKPSIEDILKGEINKKEVRGSVVIDLDEELDEFARKEEFGDMLKNLALMNKYADKDAVDDFDKSVYDAASTEKELRNIKIEHFILGFIVGSIIMMVIFLV